MIPVRIESVYDHPEAFAGTIVLDLNKREVYSLPVTHKELTGEGLCELESFAKEVTGNGAKQIQQYLETPASQEAIRRVMEENKGEEKAKANSFYADLEIGLCLLVEEVEMHTDAEEFFLPEQEYILSELAGIQCSKDAFENFCDKQTALAKLGGKLIAYGDVKYLFKEWVRQRASVSTYHTNPIPDEAGTYWYREPEDEDDHRLDCLWGVIE